MEEEQNTSSDDDHHLNHLLNIIIIPQDVLIQILVLLPVISLLRFKSVCKSWRALIQSSFFIDLHLNTTTTTNNKNNNFGTFILHTFGGIGYYRSSSLPDGRDSEAFMLSGGGGGEEVKLESLGFPSRYKVIPTYEKIKISMAGSCNGLICIHDKKGRDVSLWNPATRQFRLLPESLTFEAEILGDLEQDFVAFGYDVKTKDYKVVLISHYRPYNNNNNTTSVVLDDHHWVSVEEFTLRVQVYSLSSDSWRLLEGINYLPALPYQSLSLNHGAYLKGRYYFMGYESGDAVHSSNTVIISFDFTKEVFTTIQLPHDYHHPDNISTYQGEKLAVFANVDVVVQEEDEEAPDGETFEIWVLNEHGVKEEEEPWTKLHEFFSSGRPRGISNNGDFAFIGQGVFNHGEKLELFNLVAKEVKKEFSTPQAVVGANFYNQSLVSIGGNNGTT